MFYDTIGRFTERNVEKFSEIPESDDFGPNSGVPEGKEYGYIHAFRKPGRGRADNHSYILTINKFHNSSSSARYIFRGYFKPKISGDHTFTQFANSGVGGFMIGQSATNPHSKPTDPNNSSVPKSGKLMGAGPKKTTSGTIKLEAGKIYPFRYVLGGRGNGTLSFKDPEGVTHTSFEGYLHFTPKNYVIHIPESEQVLASQQDKKESTDGIEVDASYNPIEDDKFDPSVHVGEKIGDLEYVGKYDLDHHRSDITPEGRKYSELNIFFALEKDGPKIKQDANKIDHIIIPSITGNKIYKCKIVQHGTYTQWLEFNLRQKDSGEPVTKDFIKINTPVIVYAYKTIESIPENQIVNSVNEELIAKQSNDNNIVDGDAGSNDNNIVDEEAESNDNNLIYIISGISLLVLLIALYFILSR
jgi:hypothetical protein